MIPEIINFIYLSELLHLPVINARDGRLLGRIEDLAAMPGQVYPKVTGVLVKPGRGKHVLYIPWMSIQRSVLRKALTLENAAGDAAYPAGASENEFLLRKSFLDKQIISTSGYKVVRVNDLQLLIDNTSKQTPSLWLVHIDIGVKGLLRRLGWLRWYNAMFTWLVGREMRDIFVSWKHVQPTSTTSVSGSLSLKTDSSKLSEIHPADLADILEDLGVDERISLIESLDHTTAALTLQEMSMKIRVQVAETLEPEKLAAIINEMQMDETVDLLDELSTERRSTLSGLMPKDRVAEIRELAKMSTKEVGSIMNTDFIVARVTYTAGEVLAAVQTECPRAEILYYVYILDDQDHLKGIVTLRNLLSSPAATPVAELMTEKITSVEPDTSIKKAARIFFKYDFEALPVVDEENRMQGIVTQRDALENVFPEIREESKG
jgi:CBS domain-containing protein/sporulation protein YlmC with PRC-barrel domain